MMKFMLKQQNPELGDEEVDELVTHVLGKYSSAAAPHSSASTYVPDYDFSPSVCEIYVRDIVLAVI